VKIVGILGASHPLEKTTRQDERDSRRFSNQKRAYTCTGSRAIDNCRQLSQGSQKAIDHKPTEDISVSQ